MRPQPTNRVTAFATLLALTLLTAIPVAAQVIPEQGANAHFFHRIPTIPGRIGQQQLLRVPNAVGYFQPVQLRGPKGSLVSMAADGGFLPDREESIKAGLQMGRVYRFRIGNVELLEGYEVFPTIELINRLHPPPGMEARYPIPVEVTREEFELAIRGHMITRVIYLESPQNAMPIAQQENDQQRYFDIDRRFDLLQTADRLGRPMAILRLGSRVPLHGENDFQLSPGPSMVYPEEVEPEASDVPEAPAPATPPATATAPATTAMPFPRAALRASSGPRTPVGAAPRRAPTAIQLTPAPARLPLRNSADTRSTAPVTNATR